MVFALTHAWLLVENMPRALSFYQDMLGLEVKSNLGEYVELGINEQFTLALFERAAFQAGEPGIAISPVSGQRAALSFEHEALDEFCEHLRAKGVTFASPETNQRDWGLRTAFLYDPDGNLLCLYQGLQTQE